MARRPRATGGNAPSGVEGGNGSGIDGSTFGTGGDGAEAVGSGNDAIDAPNGIGGGEASETADFNTTEIDPAEIAGEPTQKRRRGRPPGTGKKPADGPKEAKPGRLDLSVLAQQIAMAHLVAASVLKCPALALRDDEAKALASSLKTLAAQYDIGSMVNPKVQAWLGLAGVAGAIYIPRAGEIKDAIKTRNAKDVTPHAEVTPPGAFMG